jgi:predicted acyl esterase
MTDTGGIVIERDLMVPARDGVLLGTDVYRPEGPGRHCQLNRVEVSLRSPLG